MRFFFIFLGLGNLRHITKCKRLIPNRIKNYGISYADMYQMYAYFTKYTTDKTNVPEVWLLYHQTIDMHELLLLDSGDGTKVRAYFIDVVDKNLNDLRSLKELIISYQFS